MLELLWFCMSPVGKLEVRPAPRENKRCEPLEQKLLYIFSDCNCENRWKTLNLVLSIGKRTMMSQLIYKKQILRQCLLNNRRPAAVPNPSRSTKNLTIKTMKSTFTTSAGGLFGYDVQSFFFSESATMRINIILELKRV